VTAAVVLTGVLAVLAAFQLALTLGAPFGRFAWGGQHRVLPARLRVGSAVGIATYAFIAVLALDRVGAVDAFPGHLSAVGMWVVVGYFALGVGVNAISRSISERRVMVPVTIVLTALSLLVALG
jgi:hypothetical protein